MASTSDIRNGLCIEWSNDIFKIVEFQHVKPGKGAAFVRTKLKSLTTGKVLDNTFPAGHKIQDVRIERRKFQYLYNDDMGFHFMNTEDYNQVTLKEDFIENAKFLKENMEIDVLYHADKEIPLICELPQHEQYEVTYTEPGVRGDTATNVTKPATIEGGAEIKVPIFINQGDIVKVDTHTGSYLERVKQ